MKFNMLKRFVTAGLAVFFGGVPKGSMTELDCNLIHYNNIWIKGHFGASYS